MDSLVFQPKLGHRPLALAVLMPLVAAGLLVAWNRAWLPGRTWTVAVALQALLVASGWQAMESGEEEEGRVEEVVGHELIHEHEEAAEGFMWAGAVVLAIMGAPLALHGRRAGQPLAAAGVVGTLVVAGLAMRTGELGGALVYEHGAAQAYTEGTASKTTGAGGDRHGAEAEAGEAEPANE